MNITNPVFLQVVQDIKSLHIQGAQKIAKEAVRSFSIVAEESFERYHHMSDYARVLKQAKDLLCTARPTEPLLRNSLESIYHNTDIVRFATMNKLHEHVMRQVAIVQTHFDHVHIRLPSIGELKIKSGMCVFTHCHSSSVVDILIQAHHKKKLISVVNTETRPNYQGRITAEQLSKAGIGVEHYIDSAMRLAIKKADIVLLGADAIDYAGNVINKIGSELVCESAKRFGVPVYICTDSWKYDSQTDKRHEEEIEIRSANEIWDSAPKGVKICNYAFEKIDAKLITGIICEKGIFTPQEFVRNVREDNPLFNK